MSMANMVHMHHLRIISVVVLVTTTLSSAQGQGGVRFMTYNAHLSGHTPPYDLVWMLSSPNSESVKHLAHVIQKLRPDVLTLNEFDYDENGLALALFQQNYLGVSQSTFLTGTTDPITYPYVYYAPSNTGMPSHNDYDNNGTIVTTPGMHGYGEDCYGFGDYEGEYAMVVLSKYPILFDQVRTFQTFKWRDLPDADRPPWPGGPEPYWYDDDEWDDFRLSSKSHWDVPIDIHGRTVHVLLSHPTPPVFDQGAPAETDYNGRRNFEEIRFWVEYITGANFEDDAGLRTPLPPNSQFVVMGDLNADPESDSRPGASDQVTAHSLIFDPQPHGPAGDVSYGGWRLDYVLPSANLHVLNAGVFNHFADPDQPWAYVRPYPSDHYPVYTDIQFPGVPVPPGLTPNDMVLGTSTSEREHGATLLWGNAGLDCPLPSYDFRSPAGRPWADEGVGDDDCCTFDPADVDGVQGVEFDNAHYVSHNALGNLLGVNFGNSWTGLTIYNIATDGGGLHEELWGVVGQTDGECGSPPGDWRSDRGTGLSVSPCNDKIAIAPSYDSGTIFVLNYDAGESIGAGHGARVWGPRETGANEHGLPLTKGTTSNTTWFDNNTLMFLNNAGLIGVWYVGDVPPGIDTSEYDHFDDGDTPMAPTVDNGWMFINSELQDLGCVDLQYSDIEYNPAMDSDHVYVAFTEQDSSIGILARFKVVTSRTLGTTLSLEDLNDNGIADAGDVIVMPAPNTPREIALDRCGNLYWTNKVDTHNDHLVGRYIEAVTGWGNDPQRDIELLASLSQYAPWTGLDVATSQPLAITGDINNDGVIDNLDLGVLLAQWNSANATFSADLNGDRRVDDLDLGLLLAHWGNTGPVVACDPASRVWYGTGIIFNE